MFRQFGVDQGQIAGSHSAEFAGRPFFCRSLIGFAARLAASAGTFTLPALSTRLLFARRFSGFPFSFSLFLCFFAFFLRFSLFWRCFLRFFLRIASLGWIKRIRIAARRQCVGNLCIGRSRSNLPKLLRGLFR